MKLFVYSTIGMRRRPPLTPHRNPSRLIHDYERQWTERTIDDTAARHFHGVDLSTALKRPILFSDWLAGHYASIDEDELRHYIQERLKVISIFSNGISI